MAPIDTLFVQRFSVFTDNILSPGYRERRNTLFAKGPKGWSKIDVHHAWRDDFSSLKGLERKQDIFALSLFLQKNGAKGFVFFGLGHNTPLVQDALIDKLPEVLQHTIEGLIITDNDIFILRNHDGESIIFTKQKLKY